MGQSEAVWETRYDKLFRAIQSRFYDQIKTPFEVRLWGDRVYRFGKGEPVMKVVVKDRDGLTALSRFDELGICEAYMNGSLDVVGDMLGFVSLRGALSDMHPFHTLWRRIAPVFLGRARMDRKAIASHYEFSNEFYLLFMDPTRCYSHAVFERDNEPLETAQRAWNGTWRPSRRRRRGGCTGGSSGGETQRYEVVACRRRPSAFTTLSTVENSGFPFGESAL